MNLTGQNLLNLSYEIKSMLDKAPVDVVVDAGMKASIIVEHAILQARKDNGFDVDDSRLDKMSEAVDRILSGEAKS